MNDLTILTGVGVLIAAVSGLAYKLGQAKEEREKSENESEAISEAKRLRERLNNEPALREEVKKRFSR